MNRSVNKLTSSLNHSLDSVFNSPRQFGDQKSISNAISSIKKRVDSVSTKAVAIDRMRDALICIDSNGVKIAMDRYARFIVRALSTEIDGQLLIKDSTNFQLIMNELDKLEVSNRLRPSILKGLIDSYFIVDNNNSYFVEEDIDSEIVGANWSKLRRFLQKNITSIMQNTRYRPRWMEVLNNNTQLFGINPCESYAAQVLSGDTSVIDELKNELSIPETSWFWTQLVRDQIDFIVGKSDKEYVSYLDTALMLISKMPILVNDTLPKLLERYSEIKNRDPHEGLKGFSISHWGNPSLEREAKWGLVSDEARQMVREWVVLEDLSDFFEVLQDDGGADQRRFKYWLRFLKQIDYAKIALGDNAMHSNKPDLVDLRNRKKNRISSFNGDASVNSFILKIGDYFFVEFSKLGNATYGYFADSLPFSLDTYRFYVYQLKNKSKSCFWGAHADGYQTWEQKFDDSLAQLGVYPDKESSSVKPAHKPRIKLKSSQSASDHSIKEVIQKAKKNKLSEMSADQVVEFLRFNNLPYIDHRKDGVGQIFVKYKQEKGMTADKLRLMGFKWRPEMGFVKTI